MKTTRIALASLLAPLSLLLAPAPAAAGIDACGNIDLEANADCTVEVEGGCEAMCEPFRFEAACAGELYVDCSESRCNASAEASCTAQCDISACEARCDVDPGSFSCQAECEAEVDADCSAECQAAANEGECKASCKATASGACEAQCEATPPSADCEARCEAKCQGECQAEANLDCQIDCQSESFVDCKTEMQGGCEFDCQQPEGALFCDGSYVDHGGNLQTCAAAIEAALQVEVDFSAWSRTDAECNSNVCRAEAEGEASVSCAAARGPGASGIFGGLLVAGIGVMVARRRRR